MQLTVALLLTGWPSSTNTVQSKYCNTVLHTSRKCHCSVGVTSGDVEVDTAIRGPELMIVTTYCTVQSLILQLISTDELLLLLCVGVIEVTLKGEGGPTKH